MSRTGLMILVIAIVAPVVRADLTPEQRRLVLDEALTAYDRGIDSLRRDPDGAQAAFRDAADRFELLVGEGVVNGRLLYNLGNAHLQAGHVGQAIVHYRRAQRYIAGDERLERNLAYARSLPRVQIAPAGTRALTDALLSWHRRTSPRTRATAFAVGYLVFWTLMTVRLFHRHAAWRYGAVAAALVALACGASLATDLVGQGGPDAGVVIADEVMVRKGNGEGYEPQLAEPLTEGVEFTLIERRDDWLLIELADGNAGWIPARSAELI